MEAVNYSDFRKNLKRNLDSACDNKEVVFIDQPLTDVERKLFRAKLRKNKEIAKLKKNLVQAMKEIRLIEEGKLTPRPAEELLNALKVAADKRNRRAKNRILKP